MVMVVVHSGGRVRRAALCGQGSLRSGELPCGDRLSCSPPLRESAGLAGAFARAVSLGPDWHFGGAPAAVDEGGRTRRFALRGAARLALCLLRGAKSRWLGQVVTSPLRGSILANAGSRATAIVMSGMSSWISAICVGVSSSASRLIQSVVICLFPIATVCVDERGGAAACPRRGLRPRRKAERLASPTQSR